METILLIDACRRSMANKITLVMPLYPYSRQDRKDSSRVPISASILANLLENAINYGVKEVGSVVVLGAKENSDDISIWVSDNGQGIKDSDKEKVLDRFTRLDSSRNTKGSGLGRNLVNSVVKFHRGKLKLLDAKPNGLLILIDLPKSRSS